MIKVLIFCAGEGHRWGDYQGIKKQMAKIDGVSLLDRMICQCHKYNDCLIIVNGPLNNPWYNRPGAVLNPIEITSNKDHRSRTLDKCINSIPQWSSANRTVCLLGDVWYEDNDMEHIINAPWETFIRYSRTGRSLLTGKYWGEDFACSFYPKDQPEIEKALKEFIPSPEGKETPWSYVEEHFMTLDDKTHRYEVTGFTEDFDRPQDYLKWLRYRDKHRYEMFCTDIVGV